MSVKIVYFLQHLLNSVGSDLLEFGEVFGKTAYVLPRLVQMCLGKLSMVCFIFILICKLIWAKFLM